MRRYCANAGARKAVLYVVEPKPLITGTLNWIKLKTNSPMERLLNEARRRTNVVGAVPDGKSALMLVAARLRHVASTSWGTRKYMNMKLLEEMDTDNRYAVA